MSGGIDSQQQQLIRYLSESAPVSIKALAIGLNTSETQVRRLIQPLLENNKIQRLKHRLDSGQVAYVYSGRGVERHKVYVTAPCPRCGQRRRLVRRRDGYWLLHCGSGALIEMGQ